MNSFQIKLIDSFKEKKKLSDSSIMLYMRNLKKIADDDNFKNLNFLKKYDEVIEKIKDLNPNTRRNFLISICSSLKVLENKTFQKVYEKYFNELKSSNATLKQQEASGEPTAKQIKNNIEWNDVIAKYNELKERVKVFKNKKKITDEQYEILQQFILLSFYTLLPPRRNEYRLFNIIKGYKPLDKNVNYFDIDNKKLYFNNYKTAKTESKKNGPLVIDSPPELTENINLLIKYHKLITDKKKFNEPLFVYPNNEPYSNNINSIYYLFKKIFGKTVSSTALRHSFLNSKYGDLKDEMQDDAKLMSHSVSQQKDYIKKI